MYSVHVRVVHVGPNGLATARRYRRATGTLSIGFV